MAIVNKGDKWAVLPPPVIQQIKTQFCQFSQAQVRKFLLSLALDTSANTDDDIVFVPLSYLVSQCPVAIPKQSSIQQTMQQFSIDKKIAVNSQGVSFETAMMFNQMGILGNYEVGHGDNLDYLPDFSKALHILLTKQVLSAEDFINIVHYLFWVWETRFYQKDFYPQTMARVTDFLKPPSF